MFVLVALANLGQEVHLPQHFAEHCVDVVHLCGKSRVVRTESSVKNGIRENRAKENKASMFKR